MRAGTAIRMLAGIAVMIFFLTARPAGAVQEGELGLAPQVGLAHLAGDLGDHVRDGVAFGLNIAYGVLDWLAFEVDGLYSIHSENDRDRDGDLRLDLGRIALGPRFTLGLGRVDLWAAAGGGAVIHRSEVKYPGPDGRTDKKDESGVVAGVSAALGVDFHLADTFAMGLAARGVWGLSKVDFPSPAGQQEERPIDVIPLVRASFLF